VPRRVTVRGQPESRKTTRPGVLRWEGGKLISQGGRGKSVLYGRKKVTEKVKVGKKRSGDWKGFTETEKSFWSQVKILKSRGKKEAAASV